MQIFLSFAPLEVCRVSARISVVAFAGWRHRFRAGNSVGVQDSRGVSRPHALHIFCRAITQGKKFEVVHFSSYDLTRCQTRLWNRTTPCWPCISSSTMWTKFFASTTKHFMTFAFAHSRFYNSESSLFPLPTVHSVEQSELRRFEHAGVQSEINNFNLFSLNFFFFVR